MLGKCSSRSWERVVRKIAIIEILQKSLVIFCKRTPTVYNHNQNAPTPKENETIIPKFTPTNNQEHVS